MIAAEEIVGETMRHYPQTIRVFLDFRFGCVGCPIACLHTIADAAFEHGAKPDAFFAALNAARQVGAVGEISKSEQSDPSRS